MVDALVRAVGLVIGNARSYARGERQRQWLEASAHIVEALQPPVRVDDALAQIIAGVRRVLSAPAVAVLRRTEQGYAVTAADGPHDGSLDQLVHDLRPHIERADGKVELVVLPGENHDAVVLVPMRAHLADTDMLLVVLATGSDSLGAEDTEVLASFADQASLALDRAQALSDRGELLVVADRERIARDLHDLVIQRLFATALQLQGARKLAVGEEVRGRLDAAVGDLDVTIRDIRSTIFELQRTDDQSLRADVRGVVLEYVPVLKFTPLVRTVGPVDTATSRRWARSCSRCCERHSPT